MRDSDGKVRAFHNICRHRGNKLVWNDFPKEETTGICRQFTCKYHGWRYDLDGALTFVQQEDEFFDLDKDDYGLVPDALRRVGGLHLHQPGQGARAVADGVPRTDGHRPGGLPLRPDDGALVLQDGGRRQLEALHGRLPGVLPRTGPPRRAVAAEVRRAGAARAGFEAPHYRIDGPHRLVSTSGIRSWELDDEHASSRWRTSPAAASSAPGTSRTSGSTRCRRASTRRGCDPWGIDSFQLFPNFVILFWSAGLVPHLPLLADVGAHPHLRGHALLRAGADGEGALAHEMAAVSFKEFALQDANTLEATQTMLESRVVSTVPTGRPGSPLPPPAQGDGRLGLGLRAGRGRDAVTIDVGRQRQRTMVIAR